MLWCLVLILVFVYDSRFVICWVLFFQQVTADEMRIRDWSPDVWSSALPGRRSSAPRWRLRGSPSARLQSFAAFLSIAGPPPCRRSDARVTPWVRHRAGRPDRAPSESVLAPEMRPDRQ